ncbi:Hypothetical_protein [Hexamita inflata]|uniref:Hypothetical_protein n=1 Tax=Hexamita inflata TaxID=28002 RepID=A0AA86QF49_9EUKA|nr:Hypothetical protein HINF_LOCUS38320 [Hexamita inflata]
MCVQSVVSIYSNGNNDSRLLVSMELFEHSKQCMQYLLERFELLYLGWWIQLFNFNVQTMPFWDDSYSRQIQLCLQHNERLLQRGSKLWRRRLLLSVWFNKLFEQLQLSSWNINLKYFVCSHLHVRNAVRVFEFKRVRLPDRLDEYLERVHVSVWNDNRDRDTEVQVHGPVHTFQWNSIPVFVLWSDYQHDQRVLFQRHRLLKLVSHLLHLSKWRSVIVQQQSPVCVSKLSVLTIHCYWMQSRRLGASQLSL